jgi:hypothetical protein
MSREPTSFGLCVPGIVAGLMLATVMLAPGDAVFPHAIQEVLPLQTFEVLPGAADTADRRGVMSHFSHSRAWDEEPRQNIPSDDSKKKICFSSGGTDAL